MAAKTFFAYFFGVEILRSWEELYSPCGTNVIHLVTTPLQFSQHQNTRMRVITFMSAMRLPIYPRARFCCGQPPPFILLESLPQLSMSEWSCRRVCLLRERSATQRSSQLDSQSTSSRLPPSLSLQRTSLLRPSLSSVVRSPERSTIPSRSFLLPNDRPRLHFLLLILHGHSHPDHRFC